MTTVAKRIVSSVLAQAEGNFFLFSDFKLNWGKASSAVRAVAVGLIARFSTAAPEICSRLYFKDKRFFVSNGRFRRVVAHIYFPGSLIINQAFTSIVVFAQATARG